MLPKQLIVIQVCIALGCLSTAIATTTARTTTAATFSTTTEDPGWENSTVEMDEETTSSPRTTQQSTTTMQNSSIATKIPTTATITEETTQNPPKTTQKPSTTTKAPKTTVSPSDEILKETNATIQKTEFTLYKQKVRLTLNFLKIIIPHLQVIQKNVTALLKSNDPATLSVLQQGEETLENELTAVETSVEKNRRVIQKYSEAYDSAERELKAVHETLGNILFNTVDDDEPNAGRGGNPNILTTCGGSLNSSQGSIKYKNGQTLSQKEGCIWIVSTMASAMTITLQRAQFQHTHRTYLAVGYFQSADYETASNLVWRKFSDVHTIEVVPARVAYIHFVASGDSPTTANKGFHLDFQANLNAPFNSEIMTYTYTNIFLKDHTGSLKYPLTGNVNYANNERTTIVIQPVTVTANSYLTVKWLDCEVMTPGAPRSFDALSVWNYYTSDSAWSKTGWLTGKINIGRNSPYAQQYRIYGPMLLTFKSDGSNTNTGFEIMWNT